MKHIIVTIVATIILAIIMFATSNNEPTQNINVTLETPAIEEDKPDTTKDTIVRYVFRFERGECKMNIDFTTGNGIISSRGCRSVLGDDPSLVVNDDEGRAIKSFPYAIYRLNKTLEVGKDYADINYFKLDKPWLAKEMRVIYWRGYKQVDEYVPVTREVKVYNK